MKKRFAALLVLAALLLALAPGAQASGSLFFVGVNDDIPLLLPGDTAAYYAGGLLYAPYTVFDCAPNNINASYSAEEATLLLFTMNQRLLYDLSAGVVTDRSGTQVPVDAVYRNGILYIPVEQAAKAFGLSVSLMSSETGCLLLRFTNGSQTYDNEKFLSRSELFIQHMLDSYGDLNSGEIQSGDSPEHTEPEEPTYTGARSIYLALTGDAVSASTLQDLQAMADVQGAEAPAVFFLTEQQILEQSDLVWQILMQGHSIGLTVESGEADPASALRRANDALDQLLFFRSLMILLPEDMEAPDGYCVFRQPEQAPSPEDILPESDAPRLLVCSSNVSDTLSLLLDNDVTLLRLLETTQFS